MWIEQVSAEYDIPINTLRFWRSQGTGPTSARIGRRVAYRRADVAAWLEAQFEKAAGE